MTARKYEGSVYFDDIKMVDGRLRDMDDFLRAPNSELPDPFDEENLRKQTLMTPSMRAMLSASSLGIDDIRRKVDSYQKWKKLSDFQTAKSKKVTAESQTFFGKDAEAEEDNVKPSFVMEQLTKVGELLGAPKRLHDRLIRYDKLNTKKGGLVSTLMSGAIDPLLPEDKQGLKSAIGGLIGGIAGAIGGAYVGMPTAGFGAGWAVGSSAESAAEAIEQMIQDPEKFRELWAKASKGDTFGRIVAADVGLERDTAPYKFLSGTVDMVTAMSDDPTSYLAPVLRVAKATKYMGSVGEGTQLLRQGGRVTRTGVQLAKRGAAPQDAKWLNTILKNDATVATAKKLAQISDPGLVERMSQRYGWGFDDAVINKISKATDYKDVLRIYKAGMLGSTIEYAAVNAADLGITRPAMSQFGLRTPSGKIKWYSTSAKRIEGFRKHWEPLPHANLAPGSVRTIPVFFGSKAHKTAQELERLNHTPMLTKYLPPKVRGLFRIANSRDLDLESPRAAKEVRRMVELFWDDAADVDAEVSKFLATRGDRGLSSYARTEAALRDIIKRGIERKGITPEQIAKMEGGGGANFLGTMALRAKAYGGELAGLGDERVLVEAQLKRKIMLPTYKDLIDLNREAGNLAQRGIGTISEAGAQFTSKFKNLWLLRPAFAARAVIDETVSLLGGLKIRPIEWAGAVGASISEAWASSPKATVAAMGRMLDDGMESLSRVPGLAGLARDFGSRHSLDMGQLEAVPAFLRQQEHGNLWRSAYADAPDPETQAWMKSLGLKGNELDKLNWGYITKEGSEGMAGGIHANRAGFYRGWHHILNHQLRHNDVVQILLENADNATVARKKALDYLQSPQGERLLSALGWDQMADEVKPGPVPDWFFGATQNASDADKTKLAKAVKYLDVQETILNKLAPTAEVKEALLNGGLSIRHLEKIPWEQIPEKVPGFMLKPGTQADSIVGRKYREFSDWGWHQVGGIIDNFTRKPSWRIAYRREVNRLSSLAETAGLTITPGIEEQISRSAHTWAMEQVLRLTDNPMERTRFDILTRAFLPFSFAHTQFVKRFSRVAAENPSLVRKFETFLGTGTDAGWFDKDDNGNTTFSIPVSNEFLRNFFTFSLGGAAQRNVPGMFQALEGYQSLVVPKGLPFSTSVLPGFGPVVQLPAVFLTTNKPKWSEVRDFVLGPSAGADEPGRGFLHKTVAMLGPAWMERGATAAFADEGDRAFGNAYIDVLRWKAFNGSNILDPNVQKDAKGTLIGMINPFDHQKILETTRGLFLARMASAFFGPYSQTPNLQGLEVVQDLKNFKDEFGPEEGLRAFLEKWGDKALPYTIGKSKRTGRAPQETSSEFEKFASKHKDFFDKYGEVAGFFAPQGGDYDSDAYMKQVKEGRRMAVPPSEWLANLVIRKGDDFYYDKLKPEYERKMYQEGWNQKDLSMWYAQQKNLLNEAFPGWLTWHSQGKQRADYRKGVMEQLFEAVDDPSIKGRDAEAVRRMVSAYAQALSRAKAKGYRSLSAEGALPLAKWVIGQYKDLDEEYKSESLRSLYKSLIRFEVEAFAYDEVEAI